MDSMTTRDRRVQVAELPDSARRAARLPRWALQRVADIVRENPDRTVPEIARLTDLRANFVRACLLSMANDTTTPSEGSREQVTSSSTATKL